jgi:hypothetical protein
LEAKKIEDREQNSLKRDIISNVQEEIKKALLLDGYTIIRRLDSISSQKVYLSKRDNSLFVLKWPQPEYNEEEALRRWPPGLAPEIESIPGGGFALQYLEGSQPFFWSEEDYQKLFQMFSGMKNIKAPPSFPPLENHLRQLEEKYSGLSFPKIKSSQCLVHGDLHP